MRTLLIIADVIAVSAVTLALALGLLRRSDGPLQSGSPFIVRQPLRPGAVMTWGTALPENPTDSPITIERIEPVNPRGIEVVGIGLTDPTVTGGIGTAFDFPPAGLALTDVEGAALGTSMGSGPYLQVLIGVKLSGDTDGFIEGLRLAYSSDGVRYEIVLPTSLEVTALP